MYNKISKYYDKMMGEEYFEDYFDIIYSEFGNNIKNKKILDLGCGTGTFLKNFSKENFTFGVDLSKENIKIARDKDKNSIFKIYDISKFLINKKFDLIICSFDTINHLLSAKKWEKTFFNISKMLEDNGCFIFDMNSIKKFENIDLKTISGNLENNLFYEIKTKKYGYYCDFFIKIFNKYGIILEESTKEITFEKEKVFMMLKKYFGKIEFLDEKSSENRYFFKIKK